MPIWIYSRPLLTLPTIRPFLVFMVFLTPLAIHPQFQAMGLPLLLLDVGAICLALGMYTAGANAFRSAYSQSPETTPPLATFIDPHLGFDSQLVTAVEAMIIARVATPATQPYWLDYLHALDAALAPLRLLARGVFGLLMLMCALGVFASWKIDDTWSALGYMCLIVLLGYASRGLADSRPRQQQSTSKRVDVGALGVQLQHHLQAARRVVAAQARGIRRTLKLPQLTQFYVAFVRDLVVIFGAVAIIPNGVFEVVVCALGGCRILGWLPLIACETAREWKRREQPRGRPPGQNEE